MTSTVLQPDSSIWNAAFTAFVVTATVMPCRIGVDGRRRDVLLPNGWPFLGKDSPEPLSILQSCHTIHEAAEARGGSRGPRTSTSFAATG